MFLYCRLSAQRSLPRTFSDGNFLKTLNNKMSDPYWKSAPSLVDRVLKTNTLRQRSTPNSTTDLVDLTDVDNGIISNSKEPIIDEDVEWTDKASTDGTKETAATSPEKERLVKDERVEIGMVRVTV